ncbi:Rep [uncultured virus]|uniref:Rep n=1 Tax=uncultured virus TaxID=340016 RepID=A0A2K9LWR0_9VIRU|nr:Rep [uncultured virus]
MSATITTERDGGEGNTQFSSPAKDSEGRCWFFTWNNYTFDDICDIETWVLEKNGIFVFQEEVGEECGTEHMHGVFKLKSSIRFSTLKNRFPYCRWERPKKWNDVVKYCTKTETRVAGPYYYNWPTDKKKAREDRIKKSDRYRDNMATEWQKNICNLMNVDPEDRKIYWYYDSEGNSGKTCVARHLCIEYPGEVLYVCGKATDIKYAIREMMNSDNEKDIKLVIFDFPRTSEKFISYQAIEEIKNGIFFSGKYEGGMSVFVPPHVVVFSNFWPDEEALSADRWVIKDITKKGNA